MGKNKVTVIGIADHVYKDLAAEAKRWFPKETGGVLMGYWINSYEVVITNVIGPGPKAIHMRYSFTPDDEFQIKAIAELYLKTEAKETYLGDWHTHPNAEAYLSDTDKKTLKKITAYKPARLNKTLMMVMSIKKETYIKFWCHQFTGVLKRSIIKECIVLGNQLQ